MHQSMDMIVRIKLRMSRDAMPTQVGVAIPTTSSHSHVTLSRGRRDA